MKRLFSVLTKLGLRGDSSPVGFTSLNSAELAAAVGANTAAPADISENMMAVAHIMRGAPVADIDKPARALASDSVSKLALQIPSDPVGPKMSVPTTIWTEVVRNLPVMEVLVDAYNNCSPDLSNVRPLRGGEVILSPARFALGKEEFDYALMRTHQPEIIVADVKDPEGKAAKLSRFAAAVKSIAYPRSQASPTTPFFGQE